MDNRVIRRVVRKIGRLVVAATCVGTLGIGTLVAQPGPRQENRRENRQERAGGMQDKMEMMQAAFADIDLTDQQKAQITQLQEEFRAENAALIEELRALQEQARQQIRNRDTEGAAATREVIKAKREELGEHAQLLREQIGLILTDEQKEQLKELHGNRRTTGQHPTPGDCAAEDNLPAELNLTEEQKAEIDALRENFKASNAATIDQMKELRQRMGEQRQERDKEGAQETRKEMNALREELAAAREELRGQIGAILTEEQKTLLQETSVRLRNCHCNDRRGGPDQRGSGDDVPATEGVKSADIE